MTPTTSRARAKPFGLLAFLSLALAACAPADGRLTSIPQGAAAQADWAFETSDVPLDPGFRFGRLANGMRYAVHQNATPKGTALVRMEVAAGSLDESENERGFAHFVEHMAFNGSTRVPEGEMIRLLERSGLAFGADTNAQTSFDRTTYMLDLPRNDPALLDTALMLMRETASELSISPEAVDRERGVVLAEMRDRNTWQLRNLEDQIAFVNPGARYGKRMPIGTAETLRGATAEALKAFWRREYVPSQATLMVVGDFPPDQVEAAIRARFDTWAAAPAERQPSAGPVLPRDRDRTAIYIDPALSERITASRNGLWLDEPDTIEQRQENLLREIGYGIVNRRFLSVARGVSPPYRGAGFGTGDVFKAGRTTNLVVDTVDGKWQRGLIAAAEEYRRALAYGFTPAEVAEQIANVRTAARNAAASADTRSNGTLVNAVLALVRDGVVPSTPASSLQRLEALIPQITPASVLAALKREAIELKQPLLRFQGRKEPEGGAKAIRAAWRLGMRENLDRHEDAAPAEFAYTTFGQTGTVLSDRVEPGLNIREVRFANGVMLNIRRTDVAKDRVLAQLTLDGGDLLDTRNNPLATEMTPFLPNGGLGKHSQDQLQTILAGRTVSSDIASGADSFVASADTTPHDLELQLQLWAAFLTDPGFRPEGEVRYRLNINNFFARLRATPSAALANSIGGILSDDDPRFTLQKVEDYRKLTFAKLKEDISDRLSRGAVEIGVVGDVDEEQTIAMVARTLGALPPRETAFKAYEAERKRGFTADRTRRTIRHTGPADQALIRLTWPTRDDRDLQEVLALEVLRQILQIELTETLREKLGKAYSPSTGSAPSRTWPGYGTFTLAASIDVTEVPAVRAAIAETVASLRDAPVSDDLLLRARQPILEAEDNKFKTNRGWLAVVDRAQSQPDTITRSLLARQQLLAITPTMLQNLARRYLQAKDAVEVLVLPEGAPEPQ
ncbi:MAG TPA: insulinase family protein [Novosphingobium sp.]